MKSKESILYLVPKSSYYNKKSEVIKETIAMHQEMMNEDRELYTYMLYFKQSTYYSKSLFIRNLLSNSLHKVENSSILNIDPKRLQIEDELIYRALLNENMTHALKMLLTLKDAKINNARATRLILRFLFGRKNLDYISIKYKSKIKELFIHALGKSKAHHIVERTPKGKAIFSKMIQIYTPDKDTALEVIDFLFNKERDYKNEYLSQYVDIKRHFENETLQEIKVCKLPIEVLIGFNNFYKRHMNLTTLVSLGNTSTKQKIQLQNAVKKASNHQVVLKINLDNYSLMDLYKYLYSNADLAGDELDEVLAKIEEKTNELKSSQNIHLFEGEKFAIVCDISDSHFGSNETTFHPFYKNMIVSNVLGDSENLYYVGGETNSRGLIEPSGESNLTKSILQVVKDGHKNIIILSDGFENVGSVEDVINRLKEIGFQLNILHLNPVFSPKNFSFKSLGVSIPTVPFFDVENLDTLELFYLLNHDVVQFKKVMRKKIDSEMFQKKLIRSV